MSGRGQSADFTRYFLPNPRDGDEQTEGTRDRPPHPRTHPPWKGSTTADLWASVGTRGMVTSPTPKDPDTHHDVDDGPGSPGSLGREGLVVRRDSKVSEYRDVKDVSPGPIFGGKVKAVKPQTVIRNGGPFRSEPKSESRRREQRTGNPGEKRSMGESRKRGIETGF